MDEKNVFEWLWIVNCFGCGNARIWEYMENFSDVSEAYEAIISHGKRKSLLTDAENKSAERVSEEQIGELISYCREHRIYILTCDDEIYPDKFRSIYNPPALLFCRGNVEYIRDEFCLSIVGTRKPSAYSVRVTESLTKELAKLGITIASGFAAGIDIAANLSAVKSGGKTIAVLGCGLDHDYPKENIVYRDIIEKNGLFISEFFPKFTGNGRSFPLRNRILSALSLGTIVIEAGEKSGSLITANLALSQGRTVFAAAPHDLFDVRYGGNVELIRDGAICLCGVNDILYEYYENYGHKLANTIRLNNARLPEENPETAAERSGSEKPVKKTVSAKVKKESSPELREDKLLALEGDQAKVYDLLRKSRRPVLADELAAELGMDISQMLELLTDMELDGVVKSSAGGYSAGK